MMPLDNIDDAYTLTGVQQGMLFHSLQSNEQDDYLAHVTIDLMGTLDVDKFKSAWHDVLQRHHTLRSSFAWEGLDEPLQIVHTSITAQWEFRDERGSSNSTRSNIIAAVLNAEQQQRMDLTQAPLCRFKLLRWDEKEWTLVWTVHHLISDGGSTPVVLNELIRIYSGYVSDTQLVLPLTNAFKNYVSHELSRNQKSSEIYWHDYLDNISPCRLHLPINARTSAHLNTSADGAEATELSPTDTRVQHTFKQEISNNIGHFCREQRITLSTLINGAWGLMLGHHSDNLSPTFGVVMSGRSADLPGMESSVGLFLKTLPLRITVKESLSATQWLMSLQSDLHNHTLYDNLPLYTIKKLSGLQSHEVLFDTVVSLQGHFGEAPIVSDDQSLTLSNFDYFMQSHYPLSLLVMPGEQLRMTIIFNPELIDSAWARQLLSDLVKTIDIILVNPHSHLSEINTLIATEAQPTNQHTNLNIDEQNNDQQQHVKYWQGVLGDWAPCKLMLPDHDVKQHSASQPLSCSRKQLSHSELTLLQDRCQNLNITLASSVVAAWSLVICDLTDTQRVTFGLTKHSNNAKDTSKTGPSAARYLSTIPLSIQCDDDFPLTSWLRSIQEQMQDSNKHDSIDLAKLQRLTQCEDTEAMFDTTVVIQEQEDIIFSKNADDSLVETGINHLASNHNSLSLVVTNENNPEITLAHHPFKVSDHLAQRILDRFIHYLMSLAATSPSNTLLGEVSGVNPQPDVVHGFSSTTENTSSTVRKHPNDIVEWFSTSCITHSQSPALITTEGELSYAELHKRVVNFSIALSGRVSSGSLIALHIDDKVSFIVAAFATMMARCTYLPIDPSYPSSKNISILESAKVDAIVTDSDVTAIFEIDSQILHYQLLTKNVANDTDISASENHLRNLPHSPDDVAYVLYTSGSSGISKGVPITHSNLSYSTGQRDFYYQEHPDRFLLQSSYSFDSSVVGIYWTLLNGGALVLPSSDQLKNIPKLLELFKTHLVTHTLSLPSIYQLLLENSHANELASLNMAIVAGESLSRELVKQHLEKLDDCKLFNEYGPTECTVWSSAYHCQEIERDRIPIGNSPTQTPILIIDSQLKPCIAGTVGEILIGGPGVAKGYLHNSAATQSAFIQIKYKDIENEHWYRSGDRGYISENGALIFLGRLDTQIKFRGQRIELSEIDTAIEKHDDVARSVTVLKPANPTHPSALICFYELNANKSMSLNAESINTVVNKILPTLYVPSQYIELDLIPTLPNGKIDRDSLEKQALKLNDMRALSSPIQPEDEIERIVVETISNILGLSEVSTDDNFFKLGGDSFSAMRMIAQIHAHFNVNIRFNLLLNCTTIKDLATLIRSASMTIEPDAQIDDTFESGEI